MSDGDSSWQNYEEVAQYLLNQFASKFGLVYVEGKQKISGYESGTEWEIDAKGIGEDQSIFLIVECRSYKSSRQSQEKIGAIAYKIRDTGATGAIVVSPLGLQEGASRVARANNIHSVILNHNCTTSDYILRFLNEVHVGLTGQVTAIGSLRIVKMDPEGNIIETRNIDGI